MRSDATALRNYTREWEYDKVGNILKMIHLANGNSWNRSYNYNSNNNRLISTTVGQAKVTVNYSYNERGSMIMSHLDAMEWDFAERLSYIKRGTTKAYYNYDESGERVRKVVEKNGITETRLYLGGFEIFKRTVGNNLELERETLHIMDDTRRIAIVETLTIDGGIAVNNPVPAQRYQLSNNIESATLELDENASIISYEEYYPYGDTSYQAGRSFAEVSQKRYRYSGKEKDEESGLYYFHARYYSSIIGTFISVDPLFEKYPGISPYVYCLNNPMIYVDPTGLIVEGVTEESARRVRDVIHDTFQGERFEQLRGLFQLDSGNNLRMQRIDEGAFNEAIAGLSADERALANAYFLTINAESFHLVEMVRRDETSLGHDTRRLFGLSVDTQGSHFDEIENGGGGVNVGIHDPDTEELIGTISVVVMDSNVRVNDYVHSVPGRSSRYFSRISTPGEKLAHELLGHGFGKFNEQNNDTHNQDAIQMGNLYRRVRGKGFSEFYRDGAHHEGDRLINTSRRISVNRFERVSENRARMIPAHFRR